MRILALMLCALAANVAAEPFQNVYGRANTSLNGDWHVIVDPYEVGYYDYRRVPYDTAAKPSGGFFLDRPRTDRSELIEYDFDASPTLQVPGDWNSQAEQFLYYEGTIWYRRKFDAPNTPAQARQFLHFGAVNYRADVYLNGTKLGVHVGGFTPFAFEVTGKLRPSGNSLVVKVDNARQPEAVPTVNTDWWNYGGITRDVTLVETPATFIRDYGIELLRGAGDRVRGYVQLDGAAVATAVTVALPELGIRVRTRSDAQGRATFEAPARSLQRWTPSQPRLYAFEISTDTDRISERVGLRTIEVAGNEILLNGEPVFLRGISLHEENPLRGGRAYSQADARLLLGWAKELGCNFVRLAHYPHNEHMARVADELGLMLWEEVPVYWTIHWDNPDTLANATAQLTDLIERDRNRASVIVWSVANETPVSDARTKFLRSLIDKARALDPGRLVSAAMEVHGDPGDPNHRIVDDPLGTYTDLLSFNQYIGWYDGMPDKLARIRWSFAYDKPVMISEFGAGALQGLRGDIDERFTEDHQAHLYRETLAMLAGIAQWRGTTPWILADFRSPRRPLPGIQDGWNRKGLIGSNGEKKLAFYVLRDFYREQRRPRVVK